MSHRLDYFELPATDLPATKAFYENAFGWDLADFGPDYAATLTRALAPNGHAIIATFAPDGPEKCFGQPVQRHDGTSLHRLLGPAFRLINEQRHVHTTPSGVEQRYCYTLFQRVG